MQHNNWNCPKCHNDDFDTDSFAATGTGFARLFDFQNKQFTTVSCSNCRYTEIYKTSANGLATFFDLFTG